jgi:hypothetical protein
MMMVRLSVVSGSLRPFMQHCHGTWAMRSILPQDIDVY